MSVKNVVFTKTTSNWFNPSSGKKEPWSFSLGLAELTDFFQILAKLVPRALPKGDKELMTYNKMLVGKEWKALFEHVGLRVDLSQASQM